MDLTELIVANRGPLADPLIAAAGTDVSHWFSLAQLPLAHERSSKGRVGNTTDGTSDKTATTAKGGLEDGDVTWDPRTFVDPHTGLTVPHLPMGRWG